LFVLNFIRIKKVKFIDRDWNSLYAAQGGAAIFNDHKSLKWRKDKIAFCLSGLKKAVEGFFNILISAGHESWAVVFKEEVRFNVKFKPSLWSGRRLHKIKY